MTNCLQARYVTAHYAHLQGLRLLPLAVPFIASALWRAGWLTWWPGVNERTAGSWFVLLLGLAIAVSFVVRDAYRAEFGDVQPLRGQSGASFLLLSFVAFLVLGWFQGRNDWQIS